MTTDTNWMVKVRQKGATRWPWFLTPRGNANRLRIHAALFTEEQAKRVAAEITAKGEFEGKAVDWDARR